MWKIGFEFEFNKIKKEYIRSTKFIEKWVKDKTCYIEAVTYPVELLPDNKKRNIIFDFYIIFTYKIFICKFYM